MIGLALSLFLLIVGWSEVSQALTEADSPPTHDLARQAYWQVVIHYDPDRAGNRETETA